MSQTIPSQLDLYVADAVLGIDTLWGGEDVYKRQP